MKTRKEANGRKLVGLAAALLLCLSLLAPAAEAGLFSEKGDWGPKNFTHRVFDNDQLLKPSPRLMPASLLHEPLLTCPWSPNGLAHKGFLHYAGGAGWGWNGFGPHRWFPAFTALPVLPIWKWMHNFDLQAYPTCIPAEKPWVASSKSLLPVFLLACCLSKPMFLT